MANYLPQATGNWSTTTWITAFSNLTAFAGGNTPPTFIDDVYADGKTITVDIDTAVQTIRTTTTPRTGGLAGGEFRMNNGISLSANVIAGTTTCLTFLNNAPNFCTLYGGVTGGTATSIYGFNNNSTGTVYIYGSESSGGTGTDAAGINNNSTGTIFVSATIRGRSGAPGLRNAAGTGFVYLTGDVFGSQNSVSIPGLASNGIVVIYGNVAGGPQSIGGSGGNSYGINNNAATSVLTIYGNVSGARFVTATGYGVFNNITGATVTIYGDVVGIASAGVFNNGGGTVNIFGNCIAGGTNGVTNNSTGSVNISGNCFGGAGGIGFSNSGAATASITGNCLGGTATNSYGATNGVTAGTLTIYGNVSGGSNSTAYGAHNNQNGRLLIYGSAIPSGVANGVINNSNGFIYVTRVVGNNFGLGSSGINSIVGASNTQNGLLYVEQVEFGPRGQTPISGPVYILPSNRNTLTGYTTALGQTVTFYNSLSVEGLLPPVSSVQAGIVYNVGNSVGTMAVPSASAVQFGVPVDNTIGTAALQPQDIWGYARLSATQVDSMGDRLRNTATTQSIGYQIASFNL